MVYSQPNLKISGKNTKLSQEAKFRRQVEWSYNQGVPGLAVAAKHNGCGSYEPRQANLCLRAFRHDKF